jgi:hypothetical protein
MQLPLWLQTDCCGHTLWSYNDKHLSFIEAYVSAELRERSADEYGWSNRSLASRLPQWIKSGKHRDQILKAISKMKETIGLQSIADGGSYLGKQS